MAGGVRGSDIMAFEAKRSGEPCDVCGAERQVLTRENAGEAWKPFPCHICDRMERAEMKARAQRAFSKLWQLADTEQRELLRQL